MAIFGVDDFGNMLGGLQNWGQNVWDAAGDVGRDIWYGAGDYINTVWDEGGRLKDQASGNKRNSFAGWDNWSQDEKNNFANSLAQQYGITTFQVGNIVRGMKDKRFYEYGDDINFVNDAAQKYKWLADNGADTTTLDRIDMNSALGLFQTKYDDSRKTLINSASDALKNTGQLPDSIKSQLSPQELAQVNTNYTNWQNETAKKTLENTVSISGKEPETTPSSTTKSDQTQGLGQSGSYLTTQQFYRDNPSAFGADNLEQAKTSLGRETLRLLGNVPEPTYFPGQTYSDLTDEQLTGQRLAKNFAISAIAPGGELEQYRIGMGSLLGQLDPNVNPYLKTAAGNVSAADPAYQKALGFAGGDPTISKDWQGMDSRSGLEKYTSGEVSPYLTQLFNAQYNPLKQDLMDTSGKMMSDYERRIAPILEGAKGLSTQATRNFLESINPAIKSSANQAGQFGSTKQQIAQGLAATRVGEELARQTGQIGLAATLGEGELSDQLAHKYSQFGGRATDVLGNIVGTEWGNAQNRGLSAAGTLAGYDFGGLTADEAARATRAGMGMSGMDQAMGQYGGAYGQGIGAVNSGLGAMPGYFELGMMPSNIYQSVGGQNYAINQAGIDEAIARHNYKQLAPFNNVTTAAGIIGGIPGMQGMQSASPNLWMTTLGGALSGAGVGAKFGLPGVLIGGTLGGIGGYASGGGNFNWR